MVTLILFVMQCRIFSYSFRKNYLFLSIHFNKLVICHFNNNDPFLRKVLLFLIIWLLEKHSNSLDIFQIVNLVLRNSLSVNIIVSLLRPWALKLSPLLKSFTFNAVVLFGINPQRIGIKYNIFHLNQSTFTRCSRRLYA